MADVRREGEEIVVELHAGEKVEAVHGNVRLPASTYRGVEILEDAIRAVGGFKSVGTRLPGMVAVGTFHEAGRKVFAIVHHNTPRGVRMHFEGAPYDDVIVGCANPESVVAALGG